MNERIKKLREAGSIQQLHPDDKKFALNYWENKCTYCKCSLSDTHVEFDHFYPVIDDSGYLTIGTKPDNMLPTCRKCNRSKRNTPPDIWISNNFKNHKEIIEDIETYFEKVKEY